MMLVNPRDVFNLLCYIIFLAYIVLPDALKILIVSFKVSIDFKSSKYNKGILKIKSAEIYQILESK